MALHWHAQGEGELPGDTAWLSPREAERAARMRFAKRRNDYLLGRFTAKRAAVSRLGLGEDTASLARIEVSNAEDGAPELHLDGEPAPLAISLTDRSGWGVCALADVGLELGCDLEIVEPRSEGFVRDYLTSAERTRVALAGAGEPRHEVANLIWSAKESALKVLRTGLRRDTRSVEVTLVAGEAQLGWWPLSVELAEGGTLPGWWRRFGPFVLSLVARHDAPPPEPLRDPGVLARAAPSHAWMAEPLVPAAVERG